MKGQAARMWLFFLVLLMPLASAIPGTPAQYYGGVKFDNGPALDGMVVSARIGGQEVANAVTYQGGYGFSPSLFFVRDPDNTRRSKNIEFYVNGIKANETVKFDNGQSLRIDLSVPAEISAQEAFEAGLTEFKVAPSKPKLFSFDSELEVTLTSLTETTAKILAIERLGEQFEGLAKAPANYRFLNGFTVEIEGNVQPTLVLRYDDSMVEADEKAVKPFKYKDGEWKPINDYVLNHITNSVTFSVNAAETPYALFEESAPACQPQACDDGNECTLDYCSETGCASSAVPDGIGCSSGVCRGGACTESEAAPAGVTPTTVEQTTTQAREAQAESTSADAKETTIKKQAIEESEGELCGNVICNDNNPCTIDICSKDEECVYAAAIDGQACGVGGICQGGICTKEVAMKEEGLDLAKALSSNLLVVVVLIVVVLISILWQRKGGNSPPVITQAVEKKGLPDEGKRWRPVN